MEKDDIYRKHILDAIAAIETFTEGINFDKFLENKLVQSGVVREIEIIGEASKNLSPKFKKSHKNIPWKDISGMRDKLIHGYFSVDLEAVWQTVKEDLPKLKKQISQ